VFPCLGIARSRSQTGPSERCCNFTINVRYMAGMRGGRGTPQGEPYSPGRDLPSGRRFFSLSPTRLKGTSFFISLPFSYGFPFWVGVWIFVGTRFCKGTPIYANPIFLEGAVFVVWYRLYAAMVVRSMLSRITTERVAPASGGDHAKSSIPATPDRSAHAPAAEGRS